MCGVAGIVRLDGAPVEHAELARMAASLVHRGPDGNGLYAHGSMGFAFRRLAIIDRSHASDQPLISDDGRYVIVFNGEIYNYQQLRTELQGAGYVFRSNGDTEVLLQLYAHMGPSCLHKLNGMWAFLIYDRYERSLFGSRDRFGVKPLYWHRGRGAIIWASEIKGIVASGLCPAQLNWRVASQFLLTGELDHGLETFYEGIEQVPAGSAFQVDSQGILRQWTYWSLDTSQATDKIDAPTALASIFEDSVRLRLRADVPLGVSLSGGLDSTSIICAAVRLGADQSRPDAKPLLAFSYMPKEFPEYHYIEDTLAWTKAQLVPLDIHRLDLWADLQRLVRAQDEPVHSMTAVVGYQLMRLTSSHGVRVVLNGQGADEVLGGYSSYFLDYWVSLLKQGRAGEVWRAIHSYAGVHGGNRFQYLSGAISRLIAWRCHASRWYRSWVVRKYAHRLQGHPWFTPELVRVAPEPSLALPAASLNAVLKSSVQSSPLPLYLRIEDRNSMAHGVEARLPFMDYRLVSLAFSLSEDWKIKGWANKYILRDAMRGKIPESVRSRPDKMGFPTPQSNWFSDTLYAPITSLLSRQATRQRGIYNVDRILGALESHRAGTCDISSDLFRVVQMELLFDAMEQCAAGINMGTSSGHVGVRP